MTFCKYCGTPNSTGTRVCTNCGKQLLPDEEISPLPVEQASTETSVADEDEDTGKRPVVKPARRSTTPEESTIATVSEPTERVRPPEPTVRIQPSTPQVENVVAPTGKLPVGNRQQANEDVPTSRLEAEQPAQEPYGPVIAGQQQGNGDVTPQFGLTPPYTPPVVDQPQAGAYYPQQGTPSYPGYTPVPGAYPTPSGAYYPPVGGYQTPLPPQEPNRALKKLAEPFPLWTILAGIVAIIAVLIVLHLTGSDWANGAAHASIFAVVCGLILAVLLVLRTIGGMARRAKPYIASIVAIVLLFVYAGGAIVVQPTLHVAQGHTLESQQQWTNALIEYQLGGEHQPASENLARTYVEWGESLNKQQQYQNALGKYDIVLNDFSTVTDQVNKARQDKVSALISWGQQDMQQQDYSGAMQHFDDTLSLLYCYQSCQDQVKPLDATAYYNQGENYLSNKQYSTAVSTFQAIQTRFPDSPEAHKAHPELAKGLYGEGLQEKAASCQSAISTYQELAKNYKDTPEGTKARTALAAPQSVTGHFAKGVPGNGYISQASLIQGLQANVDSTTFFNMLASAPVVTIASNGNFMFNNIAQGKYALVWGTTGPDGSQHFVIYHPHNSNTPVYQANVGPLCPFDFGSIYEPIPTN